MNTLSHPKFVFVLCMCVGVCGAGRVGVLDTCDALLVIAKMNCISKYQRGIGGDRPPGAWQRGATGRPGIYIQPSVPVGMKDR